MEPEKIFSGRFPESPENLAPAARLCFLILKRVFKKKSAVLCSFAAQIYGKFPYGARVFSIFYQEVIHNFSRKS